MNVRGIAEIVINVRDLATMVQFYSEVMGFERHSQYPIERPTIVFLTIAALNSPLGRAHPQLLALIDPRRHPSARDRFDALQLRGSILNHLAFEIAELDYGAEKARLTALGLDVTPSKFAHLQAKALFFDDPEGNRLELICHDSTVSEAERAAAVTATPDRIRSML